jgi:hypothetical protein
MCQRFPWRIPVSPSARHFPDAAKITLAQAAEPCFENPCVGGSIPPRATKNMPCTTPIHRDWRCRFWTSQASAPVNVHFAHPSIQHRKLMCPGRVRSGQRSIVLETAVREVSRKAGETFTQRIEGRILSESLVHQCERIIGLTSVQSDLHGLRRIATACLYRASGPAGSRRLRDSPQTPQRPIRCNPKQG